MDFGFNFTTQPIDCGNVSFPKLMVSQPSLSSLKKGTRASASTTMFLSVLETYYERTDTDKDGTPDIDDIDDDNDGILDVDEALITASCPSNVEVILLLDNSGSISSSEWDSFSAFTRDVIDELGVSGTVKMAVAHYLLKVKADPTPALYGIWER